jgi:anaerobic magnesium-protoporphyrin IX monomethyl ester cyclase
MEGGVVLMAESILREIKDLDYIVLGEGEIAFLKLLQNLSGGRNGKGVRGIALKEDGQVILQERGEKGRSMNIRFGSMFPEKTLKSLKRLCSIS